MRTLQPVVSAATQKVTISASSCLLHLFEISSANDENLSELISVLSELMPFGMGSFAERMPFGMGSFQSLCLLALVLVCLAYAFWHG